MTSYMERAASERRTWRALTTAACGHIVYAVCWDESDTAMAFDRYVAALEGAGLEGTAWSARKTNGNRAIRFENGGEVRFVSCKYQRLRGTRAGTVVMDA
jgi:hypothetical protein